jgi:hypothetical protein
MAAPSYTTDLQTISLCEAIGTWVEPSATGWTSGGTPAVDGENYIQNTYSISKAYNATGVGGMIFDYGSGLTITSPAAVFAWLYWASPNTLTNYADGGIRIMRGSAQNVFYSWDVRGKDDYAYGGWINEAVDVDNSVVTPDDTVGSPTTTKRWFGAAFNNTNAISKGSPCLVDAFRYGREFRVAGGETSNYATFAGAAAKNDANDATNGYNRWGQFQEITAGYLMKGLFIIGYGAVCDFRDSNRNIVIQNTKKVATSFNGFEIRNSSSRVDWTNINITALGTVSKGTFVVTDNADVNFDTCVFTDMSTFSFLSNSTVLNSTFRRCGQITTGGGTFTGCTIDLSTASSAVVASSPANAALISNTTFNSDGTGHGLEITGSAENMTLTNCTWTNYASTDGSTGHEAVYVNIAAGSMNLTISGGSTPSVRTAGCDVTVVSGAVNVTVTVKDTQVPPVAIENAVVLVLAYSGGPMPYDETVTIANSSTTATVTHTAHGMATNDKVQISGASHYQNNGVFTITVSDVDTYTYTMASAPGSSPTGTIKATYVALSGTTNSSGVITMSRVFASDQPISGRVRKSSGVPYYKTSSISGTIESESGYSTTVILLYD